MNRKTALEFLFFSYFSIDFETSKNESKLIEAAIERAYIDAASHVLEFNKEIKNADNRKNDIRQKCKENGMKELTKCLLKQSIDDNWHNDTVNILKNVYSESGLSFTLGIAQKWINMTIKYLFIMNSVLKEVGNSVLDDMCRKFRDKIYVPVDDYIIRAACRKGVCVPCRDENKEYSGMKTTYSYKIPWSQWDDEKVYNDFQRAFKSSAKDEHVLDYENRLWVEEAMIRKK